MSRIAVVLFNLGGPDGPAAVKPFLYNLFSDPAIVGLPALVRRPIAALIAATREKSATANYAMMGGGSPIVPETLAQAGALEACLCERRPDDQVKVFIAMRYWAPRARHVAPAVHAFAPDEGGAGAALSAVFHNDDGIVASPNGGGTIEVRAGRSVAGSPIRGWSRLTRLL